MDLAIEKIKAHYRQLDKGYRELKWNEFRISNAAGAYKIKRKLYHDKVMPRFIWNAENPQRGREYIIKNGIYFLPHSVGTANMGTVGVHQFYENGMRHLPGIEHEKRVVMERDGIILSGTVDTIYFDDNFGDVINDVKSTNMGVIWSITNGPNPEKYTYKKFMKAVCQGNLYATAMGRKHFNISFDNRGDYAFRINWYEQDDDDVNRTWGALKEVLQHVKDGVPPDTCDGLCDFPDGKIYCRHHVDYGKGKGFQPDASGANCPGRLELAERQKNRKLDDDYEKQDVRADMDALMGE